MYQNFILFHIYMKLNMFRAKHRPSLAASGFSYVEGCLDVQLVDVVRHSVPDNVHQLHVQQPTTHENPEAASAVLGS